MLWMRTLLLFNLGCQGENLVGRAGVPVSCGQGSASLEEKSPKGSGCDSLKPLLRILRFEGVCRLLCVSTLWIQIGVRRLSAASLSSHLAKKENLGDLSLVRDMA